MTYEDEFKDLDQRLHEFSARVQKHKQVMDGVVKRLKQMIEDANIAIDDSERSIIQCEDALFNHEDRISVLERKSGIRSKPMTLREKSKQNYTANSS